MSSKQRIEFFPEVVFTIPKSVGGSCCLKPIPQQTEESRRMYRFAQHIRWKYKEKFELIIPSRYEGRVRVVAKWRKFRARMRMRRLGIKKLPALVLDGNVLCQGMLDIDEAGIVL